MGFLLSFMAQKQVSFSIRIEHVNPRQQISSYCLYPQIKKNVLHQHWGRDWALKVGHLHLRPFYSGKKRGKLVACLPSLLSLSLSRRAFGTVSQEPVFSQALDQLFQSKTASINAGMLALILPLINPIGNNQEGKKDLRASARKGCLAYPSLEECLSFRQRHPVFSLFSWTLDTAKVKDAWLCCRRAIL